MDTYRTNWSTIICILSNTSSCTSLKCFSRVISGTIITPIIFLDLAHLWFLASQPFGSSYSKLFGYVAAKNFWIIIHWAICPSEWLHNWFISQLWFWELCLHELSERVSFLLPRSVLKCDQFYLFFLHFSTSLLHETLLADWT